MERTPPQTRRGPYKRKSNVSSAPESDDETPANSSGDERNEGFNLDISHAGEPQREGPQLEGVPPRTRRGPYKRSSLSKENQSVTMDNLMSVVSSVPESDDGTAANSSGNEGFNLDIQSGVTFSWDEAMQRQGDQGPDDDIDQHTSEIYPHVFEAITQDIQEEFPDELEYIEDIGDSFEETESLISDPDEMPIYPGASVTVGAMMLLIAVFTMNHNITGDGIQQLLSLFALLLPNDHLLCRSLHRFKLYFRKLKNPLVLHYYCSYCFALLHSNNLPQCPNTSCGKVLNKGNISYFVQVPLIQQLKNFFVQDGFYNRLQGRFNRRADHDNIEDIYDGNLYKQNFDSGFLSCPDNISFIFNTDGAPVFKSSKVSIWPLYLCINELDYKTRMRKEYMLFAGLWFGNSKPAMWTFLKPFWEEMKLLYSGVECEGPDRGNFICRAILLCGTADLPARSLMCNSIQYNGAHSCWKCLQKGKTAAVGKGHAHVFPYEASDPKGPARTSENVISFSKLALEQQRSGKQNVNVNGVKGPSWLMFFPMFDIVRGVAIDYMHGVLLGVQKLLLKLWFDKSFSQKTFSAYTKVGLVDSRLADIKPTLDITRLPRSISTDFKYWKASEFRSFLLFYGPPVLHGILDHARFEHYMLLTNAIFLLLQSSISRADIDQAETMLFHFCSQFHQMYDVCYMTLNVHQLLHLADGVRDLGPLFTHSCFSFEDKNGFVLKLIRGTQNIDSQLITGISFVQKLPELKDKCILNGSNEEKLYFAMDMPHLLKRGSVLAERIYVLGAIKKRMLKPDEFDSVIECLGYVPSCTEFSCFNRIEINGDLIYGSNYDRMQKRNQSTVKYNCSGIQFGSVRCFVQYQSDNGRLYNMACVEKLRCLHFDPKAHIVAVKTVSALEAVPIECIISNCMMVTYSGSETMYVCEFPNKLESD